MAILLLFLVLRTAATSQPPHLVLILADDLGRFDVGTADPTVLSPEIDALSRDGVQLDALYTWSWCAPSRGALLSGRYAPNTGFEGPGGPSRNGKGHVRVFPTEYDLLPKMLKPAGYTTLMAGKYHLGFARTKDLPEERGFDAYLGYLSGGEDYYTHAATGGPGCEKATDLWYGTPGHGRPPAAGTGDYSGVYSTELYTRFLTQRIAHHDPSTPLFIYAAFQGVHYPLQVPKRFFDRYVKQGAGTRCVWEDQPVQANGYRNGFACSPNTNFSHLSVVGLDCECNRLLVKAQVSSLSEAVGNITDALKARGMWNNSVLVFMGDNGGPLDGAHSNAPLRGGKLNFFEGGVRPAAFVHSPLLPKASRGRTYSGIVHETDWFATFAGLAGLKTAEGIDGVDFWPTLLNLSTPHRTEVLVSDFILRVGPWKMVAGTNHGNATSPQHWRTGMLKGCMLGTGGGWLVPPTNATNRCPHDIYTGGKGIGCPDDGPQGRNRTQWPVRAAVDQWLCSDPCTPQHPCLWNVEADPQERQEVSQSHPDIVRSMLQRLEELQKGFRDPTLVPDNGKFCKAARARARPGVGPVIGPWID